MEIIVIALSMLSILFFTAYVITLKKLKSLHNEMYKAIIYFNLMKDSDISKEDEDIHKENFIKFLSDSREWAYNYIENVQTGLKHFIDNVEPHLKYYNKYGIVIEGMISPHDFALTTITQEFEKLKLLLPEETDDRR